ncbi:sensor histidine kinase KdpD [Caulobacter sp. S45]|uniref:sensor histidine kinase n=1 Tax=Caulobacter sp. S45 TaxID=1641861 RepID=UPI0021113E9D|nr:sensor histidine kinase KdpD [Caulobacter sp. S45]
MATFEDPRRPDPDALLARTRAEGRGELRVFLGMAPGVGKTYEMLSSAARRREEGADVVVGVVETHGRRETEALTEGLETLARQPIEHRGRMLLEFDLDAALVRRPGLLLVDEYAHSNAPGSRHPKRWQDVEELLAAGIDVWTTLNVQHLESLVDVVWRITGVRVRETVPDSALSRADEIEVIDLTPDELRKRLAEGKVYVPETARLAADRFFKPENLTALREMALRRAAQTVDDKLVGQMRAQGIEGPWAAGERILVLVGGEPFAGALVRAGKRLSDLMMDAPWTVLHVERPNRPPHPDAVRQTASALKLAEQLGGGGVTLSADDLPSTVLQYARRNNVTQIVIGRASRTHGMRDKMRILFGRSLTHTLVEQTRGAALHVVTDTLSDEGAIQPEPTATAQRRVDWVSYAAALGLVTLAGLVATAADRYMANANLAMIFLASVLVSGAAFGFGPGLLAAALAAVSYNFFFLEPRLSFRIGHAADLITFAVFFAVAMTTGLLTGRVRDQARQSSRRASIVASLLAASRRLSAVSTREEAAQALAEQASGAAAAAAVVLLPEAAEIRPAAASPNAADLSTAAMTAARWAWEKGEPAGAGTGTLPQIEWTFWPLQGLRARSGVAGISAKRGAMDAGEERLLLALLDQGAVALERAELASATVEAETLRRSDQLRAALLNSISHDLRTPLSTVLGSATTLLDYGATLGPEVYRDLLESIREDAHRLNRYVGDLLDMTRLEGGGLNPHAEWTDVRDVLAAAIERVERRLGGRRLARDFPAELSLVKTDAGLLEQAVVNVLENAIAYSSDDTDIEVASYEDRGNVVVSIEDEGKGIPPDELARVFDKFRRLEEPSDRGKGIGLGLSISKGFVEAVGGRIAAASPIHGDAATGFRGTRVLISLPKHVPTHYELL